MRTMTERLPRQSLLRFLIATFAPWGKQLAHLASKQATKYSTKILFCLPVPTNDAFELFMSQTSGRFLLPQNCSKGGNHCTLIETNGGKDRLVCSITSKLLSSRVKKIAYPAATRDRTGGL